MDLTTLNELKANKEPNLMTKNLFNNEIGKILKEEGISVTLAEHLLYMVKCDSAKSVIAWNDRFDSDIQFENITKYIALVKNSQYSNSEKFRIYINFLAFQINSTKCDNRILCSLLSVLPPVSYNKEKKRSGDVFRNFKSCFVEKLNDRVRLPVLRELNFENTAVFNEVLQLFKELILSLEDSITVNSSELLRQNRIRLKEWIGDQTAIKNADSVKTEPDPDQVQSLQNSSEKNTNTVDTDTDSSDEKQNKPVFKNEISKELLRIATEIELLEEKNSLMQSELKDKTEELNVTRKLYDSCSQKCKDLLSQNEEKGLIIEEKENEISHLNRQIAEMTDKITRQADAMGTIKDSHGRETDETLNRIASVLKKYYDDYVSCIGMEMTIDLGENMRDMVEDIFKKLEKNGVNIKER